MDLTKKSALDTESKFKRFFILFLKEINGVHYWKKHVNSKMFIHFNEEYVRKHDKTNYNWWNKNYCIEILGSCNFSSYMESYNLSSENRPFFAQSYYLFAAFLIIFWIEEYRRYSFHLEGHGSPPIKIDFTQPREKHYELLINRFKTRELKEIIKRWIILKKCCNED